MSAQSVTLGIVGASGLVGRELSKQAAEAGWRVCGFSRTPRTPDATVAEWRAWSDLPDFTGISALVNLAGDPINQKWTNRRKREFWESRIGVTIGIARGLTQLTRVERPLVLVNASAVGVYGDRGDEILEEDAPPGTGYLADLCRDWETAADTVAAQGIRVMKWRTGMVLAREGEGFKTMLKPFKMGLGGKLGSGKQWVSWIHVEDLAASILHGISHGELVGPVNGTAPEPERNADFSRKVGKALDRPAILSVPGFVLKAMLADFASVVLSSQRVVPRVLQESGFRFRYPTLELALDDLVKKDTPKAAGAQQPV